MSGNTKKSTSTLGLSAPELLNEAHDFTQFDCGEPSLNNYIQTAAKNQKNRNAVIYVVCETGTPLVKGYYALMAGSVQRDTVPGNLRRNSPDQIPITLLGRFAIDVNYQGYGVGADLLADAYNRSLDAANIVASKALVVQAISTKAAHFYVKHGFTHAPEISEYTYFAPLKKFY